jgi:hypothetical protein
MKVTGVITKENNRYIHDAVYSSIDDDEFNALLGDKGFIGSDGAY